MRAGKLRHRITIEALVVSLDSDGDQTETWSDALGKMISADIMPMSGRELLAAEAVQSELTTRIKIRHRPGIVPSMRALHRGLAYNIRAIVPDVGSGVKHLTLLCSSGVNDG